MGKQSLLSCLCLSALYVLLKGLGTVVAGNIYCRAATSCPGWSLLAPYSGSFSCAALLHQHMHFMLHVEHFQTLLGLFWY